MKYQNFPTFANHLKEARLAKGSSIYLVVTPCPFERKKIFAQILSALKTQEAPTLFEGGSVSTPKMISQLNSPSLFGGQTAVILDEVDKLKKGSLEPLFSYFESPSKSSFLLLGTSSAKSGSDLYAKGKKEIIVFDLSGEKPWDRKLRLQKYLIDLSAKEAKSLSPDVALRILDQVGLDLSVLDQEMFKLMLYAHGRSQITLEDVKAICARGEGLTSWGLVDQILWEKGPCQIDLTLDLAELLPLIGQLRYQLQLGMQVAVLVEQRLSTQEIQAELPTLRGAALEKKIHFAKQHSISYFQKALHNLFEIELLSKNSSINAPLLLDSFIFKLEHLKNAPTTITQRIG